MPSPHNSPTSGSRPSRFVSVDGDAKQFSAPSMRNRQTSGGRPSHVTTVEDNAARSLQGKNA